MEIELTKGSRFNLSQEAPDLKKVAIGLGWQVNQKGQTYDIDASVFMLNAQGVVSDEKYFVFYNNLESLDGSLKHSGDNRTGEGNGDDETIYVDLTKVNPTVQEIIFVVTIHEGQEKEQNFSQIKNAYIRIYNQQNRRSLARYNLREAFSQETALEFGRLYKKDGDWRFQAVGEGYKTGLKTFVDEYIPKKITEEATPIIPAQVENYSSSNIEAKQVIDITKKANISLLKAKVDIVLKKKNISNVVARVALVLDISGSMTNQYRSGAVQAFIERIVPVASRLDDDKTLDVWFFGSTFKRAKSVNENSIDGYIKRECGEDKRALLVFKMPSLMLELGGGNNEPLVIQDAIKKYTQEKPSQSPTLIVFLSDGGVTDQQGIKKAIADAARYPIFWQFVGLAGSNYGILEKLDDLKGRLVDNADFFHVDDLGKITDEQLYERLLNEFPSWIKQARAKNIFR